MIYAYTMEQMKVMCDNEKNKGFLIHIRTLPVGEGKEDTTIINKMLKIENNKITISTSDKQIEKLVGAVLTRWFNRELMMKTNVVTIDNIFTDLKDLMDIPDGLIVSMVKKIINKLKKMIEEDTGKFTTTNYDYVAFLEPFKISFFEGVIKIPKEMFTMPMDITRSKLYAEFEENNISVDKGKLNIIIDNNNNSFILDENMHRRLVLKVFTNNDFVVNQITGL